MILTEEEAKKKWCPKYQVSFAACESGSDCQDNRGLFPGYYCLASDCMMWRWEVTNPNYEGPEKYHDKGYCGLAGRTP